MLLSRREYSRAEPSRESKSIFIFCEGAKREFKYFSYFQGLDSRINVVVYSLSHDEDNSPGGLLEIAKRSLVKSEVNPEPDYSFVEGDQVWIVFDTDDDKTHSREEQVVGIHKECADRGDWHFAESNPCFEIWLFYHFCCYVPVTENEMNCKEWKQFVGSLIGGFDSRKHPVFIEDAKIISSRNCNEISGRPCYGTTQLHRLSDVILSLAKEKIQDILKRSGLPV